MQINLKLNGKTIKEEIADDLLLIDFVRKHGCYSVKRGCETANCGLCTVFLNGKPVLSCSVLTARANGQEVTTLEGSPAEAEEIGFLPGRPGSGAVRFLQSGLYDERIALFRENQDPTDEEILEYLSGNLCRCSGYEGQLRAMKKYLAWKKEKQEVGA